jgi:hypothetical protein
MQYCHRVLWTLAIFKQAMILVLKDYQTLMWRWTTLEADYNLTMGLMLKQV